MRLCQCSRDLTTVNEIPLLWRAGEPEGRVQAGHQARLHRQGIIMCGEPHDSRAALAPALGRTTKIHIFQSAMIIKNKPKYNFWSKPGKKM